jgi:diguanylate cyclase (GGDEF)-like protein
MTLIGVVVVLVISLHVMLPDMAEADPRLELAIETTGLALGTAAALWFLIVNPLRRQSDRQIFDTQLGRAMEMAADEQAAYRAIDKSLAVGVPRLPVELLLADSSEAHLKQAVAVGNGGRGPGCPVASPRDCPAVRRAQTLRFASNEHIDACPYLEGREQPLLSAVCVPVSVGGRSIGVVHATSSVSRPPRATEVARLEALADQSGARLGMLRVLQQTHLQAATDPLTGLLNRRAFENQAQELLRRGTPFAIAMGDLDHFKILNDKAGHEAGDRALRLFARVVRETLRAEDLACRFGGEEFVFLFPGRTSLEAAAGLERVREQLAETLASGSVPPFTSSFGVAHSDDAASLEDVIRIADAALFRAKREGRNRVVIDSITVPGDDERAEQAAA